MVNNLDGCAHHKSRKSSGAWRSIFLPPVVLQLFISSLIVLTDGHHFVPSDADAPKMQHCSMTDCVPHGVLCRSSHKVSSRGESEEVAEMFIIGYFSGTTESNKIGRK